MPMWVTGSCCGHRRRTHSDSASILPDGAGAHLPRSKSRFQVWTKGRTTAVLPSSPGTSMGSLTAWQLLAAQVMAQPQASTAEGVALPSQISAGELGSPPSAHRAASLITGAASSASQMEGELRMQEYELQEAVGQGAFGTVFRAARKHDQRTVCIKRLDTGAMSCKQRQAVRWVEIDPIDQGG